MKFTKNFYEKVKLKKKLKNMLNTKKEKEFNL